MQTDTAQKGKPVVLTEDLHTALKILAARRGKKLRQVVEEKLRELLSEPIQLQ
jgi:hypothetical protein